MQQTYTIGTRTFLLDRTKSEAALAAKRVLNPPLLDILGRLENTASYLAVGQMPGVVADAISEGRRGAADASLNKGGRPPRPGPTSCGKGPQKIGQRLPIRRQGVIISVSRY